MNIAIYTLTRDRLEYTKHCFDMLSKKAWSYPFDHFVLDNGSTDGTAEWLMSHPKSDRGGCLFKAYLMRENLGISMGSNFLLDEILKHDYDLIIKMDNDCEVVSENILGQIAEVYADQSAGGKFILSPHVYGINKQPKRIHRTMLGGRDIGITSIVGGLFHIVPAEAYRNYRYPVDLPKAWGQDDDFCHQMNRSGRRCGYIEGLSVNHYETTEGQAKRFPEYFERKWGEERQLTVGS